VRVAEVKLGQIAVKMGLVHRMERAIDAPHLMDAKYPSAALDKDLNRFLARAVYGFGLCASVVPRVAREEWAPQPIRS